MDGYEALRNRAMHNDGSSGGLSLFLTRGMAVWMRVWKEHEPSRTRVLSTNADKVQVMLPIDLQDDLVSALVGLAINVRKESR
jgi:hypothetical protein